jgi:hypothetical protein
MLFLHLCVKIHYLEIALVTTVSRYILTIYEAHSRFLYATDIFIFHQLYFTAKLVVTDLEFYKRSVIQ